MTATIFDQDSEGMAPSGSPKVVILPATHGVTPDPAAAILEASPQVELFDEELWSVPKTLFDPVVADDPTVRGGVGLEAALDGARASGALPLALAADLRDLPALVRGVGADTVLHLGPRPALAGARGDMGPVGALLEDGRRVLSFGVRELETAEARLIDGAPDAYELHLPSRTTDPVGALRRALHADRPVFWAIDVGVFDPGLMAAVDRPAPGGWDWAQVTQLLRSAAEAAPCAGFVIAGLRPRAGLHAADFLVAKLAYKMLGYVFGAQNGRAG
jgi:agmatinase